MPTLTSFQLPKDGQIYTESIFGRCRDLIRYDVWSGINLNRFDTWLTNFKTSEERYFAARVLDALIYRSDQQTAALMRQLFQRVIPDLARLRNLHAELCVAYKSLQNSNVDPCVRIVPIIPPNEPPTKSGPTVARMLRRQLRFDEKWIVFPKDVPNSPSNVVAFVFVDDFLGTGTQFSDFLRSTGLETLFSTSCFVYAPLVAHITGISSLRAGYPKLHVDTVETTAMPYLMRSLVASQMT